MAPSYGEIMNTRRARISPETLAARTVWTTTAYTLAMQVIEGREQVAEITAREGCFALRPDLTGPLDLAVSTDEVTERTS